MVRDWTKDYFHEKYECYCDMVYRICMLYLKNESDARDGLQDIFLKMWEKQPVFENASHEKAWLISTTKHYCLDVLKSSWHKKRVALDINREIMSDEREQEYPVLDEILKLPQKYREVLYLYYYEEYSVKEIGIMLKRKESTIQSRLAAGRNKLKTRLADRKGVILGVCQTGEKCAAACGTVQRVRQDRPDPQTAGRCAGGRYSARTFLCRDP